MAATLHGCSPPDLLRQLRRDGIAYAHDVSVFYRGESAGDFVDRLVRVETERARAALHFFEKGFDLVVVNLTVLDRVSHFFWSAAGANEVPTEVDSPLGRAYRLVDGLLAAVLARLGPSDHLLAFSEIGFGPLDRFVSVDTILENARLLEWNGNEPSAKSVAMEAVQGTHGVNIRADACQTIRERESLISEVRQALLEARDPGDGALLFKGVRPGVELYPGTRSFDAPDLVLTPEDGRRLPLGDRRWASHVRRELQTGWHRRESLWFGVGPRFATDSKGRTAQCPDIAATILSILDEPGTLGIGASLTKMGVAGVAAPRRGTTWID